MNSRERQEASGKSPVADRTLAKRISAILPSSITNWFRGPQSSLNPDPANIPPEPKRRRLTEDPNKYLPTTACASTNTDPLYTRRLTQKRKNEDLLNATTNKTPEDPVNRVSFILKSSLLSEDDLKPKETFVDDNRTSDMASNSSPAKDYVKPSFDINGASGSPFYPGNTTYGGASNHLSVTSRNTIKKSTSEYRLHKSLDNIDFNMSGPSKRIMDLLENYSSPLEEVRRISQFVRNAAADAMSNDPSKQMTNKTQELHVPSVATILSIKKKSVLMASTSTARQLLASQSSATKYSPYNKSSVSARNHHDNPIFKAKKRRASTSSLPRALLLNALSINKDILPNFTFTTSAQTTKKVTTVSQSTNNIEEMQTENKVFQFIDPPETADAQSNNTEDDCRVTLDSSDTTIDTSMTNDDAVCKNAPSTEISTECSNCEKENSTEDPCVPKTTNSLQWTCEDCWVKNDMSISKCVCCGGKKPLNKTDNNKTSRPAETNKQTNPLSLSINHDPSLTNKITNVKSQEENWECYVCLLKNEKQKTKCICCDAAKPDAEKSATLYSKQAEVTKSQDENWECHVCLVRNDKHNSKCVCCEVDKPGTKNSEIKFNFGLPVISKFKFGINLDNTNQAPTKEIVKEVKETNNNVPPKQFSFGLPPIHLGNNLEESKESTSNKSPQIESRPIILLEEIVELNNTYDLQTVVSSQEEHSTRAPTALPNAGQQQNTANLAMLSPIIECMNECSNSSTDANILSAPENNPLQSNESSKAGTPRPPSVLSVPDTHSFERNLNSFQPQSSLSTLFNFGSSTNQNTINIGSPNTMNFKFGNNKINSSKFSNFKFESPKIDSQGNINSPVNPNNGNNILGGNGTNAFQHGNEVSNLVNTDNCLFSRVQSQTVLPTGGLFGAPIQNENSGWPQSTNLFSAPQTLPTNQRNQALPPFTFGDMQFNNISAYNNVPTFPNNAQIPSPAFGMLPGNANNAFMVSTPTFENQANSINGINSLSGSAGGLFGQQPSSFAENNSFFGNAETSHQMSGLSFSAGQNPNPNVFNFSQQSEVRSMTGTSVPQFQVGSSSGPGQVRRIRKAVRRTTPR